MPKKRLPTQALKLHGSYNVTHHRNRTDQLFPCLPEDAIVEAPASLSDKAKVSWYAITLPLIALGSLSENDLDLIESGLQLQDELDSLQEQISALLAKKKKAEADLVRWNKLNAIRNRTLLTYIKIMSAYGVTPAARASTNFVNTRQVQSAEDKQVNPILAVLEEE